MTPPTMNLASAHVQDVARRDACPSGAPQAHRGKMRNDLRPGVAHGSTWGISYGPEWPPGGTVRNDLRPGVAHGSTLRIDLRPG
eukprot:1697501-Alexandrium_andersonii.AAC.1